MWRRAVGETGRAAEDIGRRHLQARGLRLITQNFRTRLGELDLVMRDGPALVFVEVRYRRRSGFGSGAESVDARKRQRLLRAAQQYLLTHPQRGEVPIRFDVISIGGPVAAPEIEWIRDAFRAEQDA